MQCAVNASILHFAKTYMKILRNARYLQLLQLLDNKQTRFYFLRISIELRLISTHFLYERKIYLCSKIFSDVVLCYVTYITLRIDTYGFYGTEDTLQFPTLRKVGQQALCWYALCLPTEEWPGQVECA